MRKVIFAVVNLIVSTVLQAQAPSISYSSPQTYSAGTIITPLSPVNSGGAVTASGLWVSTIAGSGAGYMDGTGLAAQLNNPMGIAVDASGNIYIADTYNNRIRKITSAGVVSTLAGSGIIGSADGTGTSASFNKPYALTIDNSGNLYVADTYNHNIRKITTAGVVTTLAGSSSYGSTDGTGTGASFYFPVGIAVDPSGYLYVADYGNRKIRKITSTGIVSTLAGSGNLGSDDGNGIRASFSRPYGITIDGSGNIFVSDFNNNNIRKISSTGIVTTFAGNGASTSIDGTGLSASFNNPEGICIDASGSIYVAENTGNKVRKITSAGIVSTIAGNGNSALIDGLDTNTSFYFPAALAIDASGNLFVADGGNNCIRKIEPAYFRISPILSNGLIFNPKTGVISGIPTKGSTSITYNITASNSTGTSNASLSISINGLSTITTQAVSNISSTTAIGNGSIINLGAPSPTAHGICWSSTGIPTLSGSFTNNGAAVNTGTFTANMTGLKSNTPYWVRAFATNTYGTTYGDIVGFYTTAVIPGLSYSSPQTYTAGTSISTLNPVISGGAPDPTGVLVAGFAGNLAAGTSDGTGSAAGFYFPSCVVSDATGNIYVADFGNNKIRKITTTGVVTTLAGSGSKGSTDGTGISASFNNPYAIAIDGSGNIYVADTYNHKIRKITAAGVVTTIAGNGTAGSTDATGTAASFNYPVGIAVDVNGNIFVSDYNHKIRKITTSGVVTTFAGSGVAGSDDGIGLSASFNAPRGITIDMFGNVYVADYGNNKIRMITSNGKVSTLAGSGTAVALDGNGTAASFNYPCGLTADVFANIYVAEEGSSKIRKIATTGVVTTIAGNGTVGLTDGDGNNAIFNKPAGVALDASGCLYVADYSNNMIRKITPKNYSISPALPAGLNFNVQTAAISGTAIAGNPTTTYNITSANSAGNNTTSVVITVNGLPVITTQAVSSITSTTATANGTILNLGAPNPTAYGFCWNTTGAPTISDNKVSNGSPTSTGAFTANMTGLTSGTIYYVRAYATNTSGIAYGDQVTFTAIAIAPNISYGGPQTYTAGTAITSLSPTNTGGAVEPVKFVSTIAGIGSLGSTDGSGLTSSFFNPKGTAVDAAGNIYIADANNHKIRKISTQGVVSTLAGSGTAGSADGTGAAASFNYPFGVAVDASGNVYVADCFNHKIRKITSAGVVTTLAGSGTAGSTNATGTAASFNYPSGVAVDASGNVYVGDYTNNKIRKITTAGVVTTLAGSGTAGSADGTGASASFAQPWGVCVDASGNVYVADYNNHKIRKITSAGVVTTLAGNGVAGSTNEMGLSASFNYPTGVSVDASGNIYVADRDNNLIRRITPTGLTTTYAGSATSGSTDQTGNPASFFSPTGIALDASGNVYVVDAMAGFYKIRKIAPVYYSVSPDLPSGLNLNSITGVITGNPTAGSTTKNYTITVSNTGGSSNASLNITVNGVPTATTQAVSAIAGTTATANATIANLGVPNPTAFGICWNTTGSPTITNNKIDKGAATTVGAYTVELTNLVVNTTYYVRAFATNSYGTSYGEEVSFTTQPVAPNISYASPQVYTAGTAITALTPTNTGGDATMSAGVSTLTHNASLSSPKGITTDALGNILVADTYNHKIIKIAPNGTTTTIAGTGTSGSVDATGTSASFNSPTGVAVDASGNIYVADNSNHKIRKITPDGVVSTLAGSGTVGSTNGTGTAASFNSPTSLVVDASGNVFVTDTYNHKIRKITSTGVVTTFVGSGATTSTDGTGTSASISTPWGIAIDASGNLYVTDGSNKIRKITSVGVVTTLAGNGTQGTTNGVGTSASFYIPKGITIDAFGYLYVSDLGNNLVRKITSGGVVSTFAGDGTRGSNNTTGNAASFSYLNGLTVDASGNIFTLDDNSIRKLLPAYAISPALPSGLSINTTTGVITGTPVSGNPTTLYTVNTTNVSGNDTTTFTISVNGISKISTQDVTSITPTTAIAKGNVLNFGYPNPTDYGFCMNTTGAPTILDTKISKGTATTVGVFASNLTNLLPNTTYYLRAYATNIWGTAYGELISFKTAYMKPDISYGQSSYTFTSGTAITTITPANTGGTVEINTGLVSTLAGSGTAGSLNGTGTQASFRNPMGVAVDASGNVYVADSYNYIIRKISVAGVVSTFAGSGTAGNSDGTGTSASFSIPYALAFDASGNLYVTDNNKNNVRKITASGVVTTIASGFNGPTGIAVDASGNIFVSDRMNRVIKKITPGGVVTVFAGSGLEASTDGTGTSASFRTPEGLSIDASGNVYVADSYGQNIRKITASGVVTTIAGNGNLGSADGSAQTAGFGYPKDVKVDALGNMYITDSYNQKIRKINTAGNVTTYAGKGTQSSTDGKGVSAGFNSPNGIAIDVAGNLYVADANNHKIRKITPVYFDIDNEMPAGLNFDIKTGAISGTPSTGFSPFSYKVVASNTGGSDTTIIQITVNGKPTVTTQAVNAIQANTATANGNITNLGAPNPTSYGVCWNTTGTPTTADSKTDKGSASAAGAFTTQMTNLLPNTTYYVRTYAINLSGTSYGDVVSFTTLPLAPNINYSGAQTYTVGTAISAITPTNSGGTITPFTLVTTLAGNGIQGATDGFGTTASFYNPVGVAVDASGNVYISDYNNHKIRKINTAGVVSTLAGSGTAGSVDGAGVNASFKTPYCLAVDVSGNIFVADYGNNKIRKITPAGVVSTFAGSGTAGSTDGNGISATFNGPTGIAIDASGNLYVAEFSGRKIRKITTAGVVTTLAGSGSPGATDGVGTAASFYNPLGITVDATGNVYVADNGSGYGYCNIRKITVAGVVSTLAGGYIGSADGSGTSAAFNNPYGVAIDAVGNVYVVDASNNKVRKITPAGVVTTQAGTGMAGSTDGLANASSFKYPAGIAIDGNGSLYISDYQNNRIRKIVNAYYSISPSLPAGLKFDYVTGAISGTPLVGSSNANYYITASNTGGSDTTTINITVNGVPSVTSEYLSDIKATSAVANGNITNLGTPSPTGYGVCWNTTGNPTITDAKTDKGAITNAGAFTANITNLSPGTNYYVRLFATNTYGTSYSDVISFTTLPTAPNTSYGINQQAYTAGTSITPLNLINVGGAIPPGALVTTLAGNGSQGSVNGIGTNSSFNYPSGIAIGANGNLYVADQANNRIRKITQNGVVTTFAESNTPYALAIDSLGTIYSTDISNNRIQKIASNGVVSTLAQISSPKGVVVDKSGNVIVTNTYSTGGCSQYGCWTNYEQVIKKITTNGLVSTLAGINGGSFKDGTGNEAIFNYPAGIAIDALGNLFVADANNNRIRKITSTGMVSTFAGNGTAGSADGYLSSATFNSPYSIAIDGLGNMYVTEIGSHKIRKISTTGIVTTLAGSGTRGATDGYGTNASFNYPYGVAVDSLNNVFVVDNSNHKIRKICQYGSFISPELPKGLVFDSATGTISGTPTVGSSTTTYTVTSINSGGSSTTTVTITVNGTSTVSTQPVSNITATTVTANGTIQNLGTPTPTSYGVCWNTTGTPTIADTKVDKGTASAPGAFTANLTNLTPLTTYYIRAYATNAYGTSYGEVVTFSTPILPPNISYTGAQTYSVGTAITTITPTNSGGIVTPSSVVSTFAGNGNAGFSDGIGTGTSFSSPNGVTVDVSGNIYIADAGNSRIRKITTDGIVSTYAGSGSYGAVDGVGSAASFSNPSSVAVDAKGNIFVADIYNHKIRKISKTGVVTTFAGSGATGSTDGVGVSASFNYPHGVAVDASGNLYVADEGNQKIRKITSDGVVTTLAGSGATGSADGIAASASFLNPYGVAVDASGNVYVADYGNGKIRKITASGIVSTLATGFNGPSALSVDIAGNIYVADQYNHRIKMVTQAGVVSTIAGNGAQSYADGSGSAASFNYPQGVTVDALGNLYVADKSNNRIRKIIQYGYQINAALPVGLSFDMSTGAISGTPTAGASATNYLVTASNAGGTGSTVLSITVNGTSTICTSNVSSITSNTAIGNGEINNLGAPNPTAYGVCWNTTGSPTIADSKVDKGTATIAGAFTCNMTNLTPNTTYFLRAYATNLYGTTYGEVVSFKTTILLPNISYNNNNITATVGSFITPVSAVNTGGEILGNSYWVSTLAGTGMTGASDGIGISATFNNPTGIAIDVLGNLFVGDQSNNKIREISTFGAVSTYAGNGTTALLNGLSSMSSFAAPNGVAIDASGNVFVADQNNYVIRKVSSSGIVSTFAGSGLSGSSDGSGATASFAYPTAVAVDGSGNVYVTDQSNHKIRKITAGGLVTTLAGSGSPGSSDGIGSAASFYNPTGLAVDNSGNVFVADHTNCIIRKITPTGVVTTLAGIGYPSFADGVGRAAGFNYPYAITVDRDGNLLVADRSNYKIRKVTQAGVVSTIAGIGVGGSTDGMATSASFNYTLGICVNASGEIYVADQYNNKIRKISPVLYNISPSLPAGINFDIKTGVISGKPTTVSPKTTYTISASNAGGTSTTTIDITVNDIGTITPDNINCIQPVLYPNPVIDNFSILGLSGTQTLTIYNLIGVQVFTQEVTNNESVNISSLTSGVYMVKVSGKEFKLIKKD